MGRSVKKRARRAQHEGTNKKLGQFRGKGGLKDGGTKSLLEEIVPRFSGPFTEKEILGGPHSSRARKPSGRDSKKGARRGTNSSENLIEIPSS